MSSVVQKKTVTFNTTVSSCPIGEITGKKNIIESKIPVISCEGACIRGEIARLAANNVSKKPGYSRGCHGELITVPESAIAQWMQSAEKVVLKDTNIGNTGSSHKLKVAEETVDESPVVI